MKADSGHNYVWVRLKKPKLNLGRGADQIIKDGDLTKNFRNAVEKYDSAKIVRKNDWRGFDGIEFRMKPEDFEDLLATTSFFSDKVKEVYEKYRDEIKDHVEKAVPNDVYYEGTKLTTLYLAAAGGIKKVDRRINVGYEYSKDKPLWQTEPGLF